MNAGRQAPDANPFSDGAPGTPAERIAAALAALRGGRRGPGGLGGAGGPGGFGGRGGFGPGGPPPWARGHGHGPHLHGGMADRLAGAARMRLLAALVRAERAAEAEEENGATPATPGSAAGQSAGSTARGALSIMELAELVGVDQPRASRLVQQATAAGFVHRSADPTDGRRSVIRITEAGRAVLAEARNRHHGAVEQALEPFTEADAEQLATLLERFAAAWPGPGERPQD